jgi:hypothetical protein
MQRRGGGENRKVPSRPPRLTLTQKRRHRTKRWADADDSEEWITCDCTIPALSWLTSLA